MRTIKALVLGGAVLALPALAQQSASFKLTEHAFNAGGNPEQGLVLDSTSFRVTLDAIGDSVATIGMTSPSFHMDGSFGLSYPPPGEVLGLRFSDHQTLHWDPEKSVGDYNLYRDSLSNLSGGGYGLCVQLELPDETTTDSDTPPSGDSYFYLVTAENRLDEEGTKGSTSSGVERLGNFCP